MESNCVQCVEWKGSLKGTHRGLSTNSAILNSSSVYCSVPQLNPPLQLQQNNFMSSDKLSD